MKKTNLFLLCVIFWMTAAAGFSGFMGKWSFRDTEDRFGIVEMLDGTATKPFVYRQLGPIIADGFVQITPSKLKETIAKKIKPEKTFSKVSTQLNIDHKFKYNIIYYLCFLSLFFSLFILRKILLYFNCSPTASIFAPVLLILAFPYIQTYGGYFYDSIEIFFMSAAFLCALRKRYILLFCLILPATLNKEVFFFFLPTLYPLIRNHLDFKKSIVLTSAMVITAGIVNIIVKKLYAANPGGVAIFHLFDNLKNYINPLTYIKFETTYGIIGPKKMSIISVIIILTVFVNAWKYCSDLLKKHIFFVICINLPLFLLFCATGELRNLSLFFVSFTVMMGYLIDKKNCSA
ncbi:hypothetical protein [Commensalibacter papalotli (ex Botero et al. 2024)]|uniref:Glycosyltransferase RgtA/B/C/D-like domain-containing protein n=1 Tax=Commensalibacter papalotli (ex Botero et al. 2024) TaxID=2972766 RepID=A0ABM9HLY4_9PROT|nr:hypothetical protein [Commensalibacter papalotli (ex Botero et al. 2024)]CAI3935502.1 unnamed protein product [Commensalibacter papalotli (ex Botero et al. 2024)]